MDNIIADLDHQRRLALRKMEACQRAADRFDGAPDRHQRAREAQLRKALDRVAHLTLAIDTLRPFATLS